ncbi:MAG: hypothetical protein QXQ36_00645 [Sulfolobales archaeon]
MSYYTIKICRNCIYWRPVLHYPSLGCCMKRRIISSRDSFCHEYARKNISWYDFMWCLNCGHDVYKEDYDLHIAHELYVSPCPDPELYEETYSAD